MTTDQTTDIVLAIIAFGALGLGLLSMLYGWIVQTYDRIMSRYVATVPDQRTNEREHRSDAAEQHRNGGELTTGTTFGTVVDYLEHCDDDTLLDILAQITDAEGDYRFAESRVAKFIPGRVEDRLAQVRAVRDTTPPPPPGRQLRVRDDHGERIISMH